jgi:enoyl-CoA hydratase
MYDADAPVTSSCFDVTITDKIAHIQMKRPDAFNSMTRDFWNELPVIVNDINDNARARVIVITSTGKHFCAGMDLSVFATGDGVSAGTKSDPQTNNENFRHHIHHLQDTFTCLDKARIPVLVAIQGGCIGGAVDFVSACDIRWATKDAFFCIQEINIGMTADVGTFPRLCKLLPDGHVRELAYTGKRMLAEQAKALGLVNDVFDTHEELVAHVIAIMPAITPSPMALIILPCGKPACSPHPTWPKPSAPMPQKKRAIFQIFCRCARKCRRDEVDVSCNANFRHLAFVTRGQRANLSGSKRRFVLLVSHHVGKSGKTELGPRDLASLENAFEL